MSKFIKRITLTPFYGCWSEKFQRDVPYKILSHTIKKVSVDSDRTMLYIKSRPAYEATLFVKESPDQVNQLMAR